MGTVTDTNGDAVAGATVTLAQRAPVDRRSVTAGEFRLLERIQLRIATKQTTVRVTDPVEVATEQIKTGRRSASWASCRTSMSLTKERMPHRSRRA